MYIHILRFALSIFWKQVRWLRQSRLRFTDGRWLSYCTSTWDPVPFPSLHDHSIPVRLVWAWELEQIRRRRYFWRPFLSKPVLCSCMPTAWNRICSREVNSYAIVTDVIVIRNQKQSLSNTLVFHSLRRFSSDISHPMPSPCFRPHNSILQ